MWFKIFSSERLEDGAVDVLLISSPHVLVISLEEMKEMKARINQSLTL